STDSDTNQRLVTGALNVSNHDFGATLALPGSIACLANPTKGIPDTWTPINICDTNAPAARMFHVALWTGSKMLIWGGTAGNGKSGGQYDPVTDTWSPVSTVNAPASGMGPYGVWTGSKMLVWGGFYNSQYIGNIGGQYDPTTDSWTVMSKGANSP